MTLSLSVVLIIVLGQGQLFKCKGFSRGEKEAFNDLSMAHTSEVIYILYLCVKEILKG